MHRLTQDHLEELLDGAVGAEHPATLHVTECAECRELVEAMRSHAVLFRQWQAPETELDPAPGFYARVLDRIDADRPKSLWESFFAAPFFESLVGRRVAVASFAVAMIMGVFLMSAGIPQSGSGFKAGNVVSHTYPMLPAADFPDEVLATPAFQSASGDTELAAGIARGTVNRNSVFLNLVTYRER